MKNKKKKLKPFKLKLEKSTVSIPLIDLMIITKWHRDNLRKEVNYEK